MAPSYNHKTFPEPVSNDYRADGTRRTRPSRTRKRNSNRRAGKAARQARKANR